MTAHPLPSMLSPSRQPFLYLASAFSFGIVIDAWLKFGRPGVLALGLSAIAVSIKLIHGKRELAASGTLLVGFAVFGALLSMVDRDTKDPSRLSNLCHSGVITPDEPVELTGTLALPPEPAPGAFYVDVDAESLRAINESIIASGRARLIVPLGDPQSERDFASLALDYGVRISVLVRLERAQRFSNPGSPDFNEFLERRGYDLKGTVKSPLLIRHLDDTSRNLALAFLYHLRLRLMAAIDARFKPRVAGVLKAMLAGNRYFLDAETTERLRQGSTFHTLVIAGLHIGILAWALLGGRPALRRRAAPRVILCLLVLWAYAIMVGLAPPVTRATTMITIGLIGPLLFRRAASVNTVALAAFAMLALKPALAADPGFQLSFVAVAGIVGLALPLADKLRRVGEWRPTPRTPHPPVCARSVRYFAEALFWNAGAFEAEMKHAAIRYGLPKASLARALGRWRIQSLLRNVVLLMITSTAIQLSTLPLMALYFNRVAAIGVLLNVVAGLLTGVLMLAGLGAIAIDWLSSSAAAVLEQVVSLTHFLLVNAIVPFSDLPCATFRVAHYDGWRATAYVLYFAPLAMLAALLDRWQPVEQVFPIVWTQSAVTTRRRPVASSRASSASPGRRFAPGLLCALALALALFAVIRPPVQGLTGKLVIHFLDVGQGDSALIVFPGGKTMLVDGGGELQYAAERNGIETAQPEDQEPRVAGGDFSVGEAVVSRFIWSKGRTSIDYVLATHAHADHIGGLSDVVRNIDARQAIVGHAAENDPEYQRFARAARERGTPIFAISAGEKFEIDGVTIEVFWPPPATGPLASSGNDDSVVLRLVYGSVSMLLAGDIEQNAEQSLIRSPANLRADVLKVPHHGSRTSSTEAFIDAVNPSYAVISVGERSRFGHPHPSVVNRYLARGVKLFQTGRDGMVTVETDGSTLNVTRFRK